MMTMMNNMNGVDQGMMYDGMMQSNTTKVAVSVKNMTCNYRLTTDDLTTVFSRYGKLAAVHVGTVDSSQATIEFVDYEAAVNCVKSLDGKVLSGEKGTLAVSLIQESMTNHSTPDQFPSQAPMQHVPQMPMMQQNNFNQQQMQSPPMYSQPRFMVPSSMPQQNFGMHQQSFMPQQQFGMHQEHQHMMHEQHHQHGMQPSAHDYMSASQMQYPQDMQQMNKGFNSGFDNRQSSFEERPKRARRPQQGDTSPSRVRKFTCRFDVGIVNEKTFQVARRIIGSKGANMKKIFKDTGAKLRLRGQGSGFLEGTSQQESPEALHLCISAKKIDEYQMAVRKVEELLQGVYREYRAHCKQKDLPIPNLRVVCREHPLVTMHRNAMKAKEAQMGGHMHAIGQDTLVVADESQPIDASCNNTPQGSPGPSPIISRANSQENLNQIQYMQPMA
jgi:hypothetical protein